jgi:hypothetical protein
VAKVGPGNLLALRHGAHSPRQIGPRATRQKRRLLRQIGLRAGDLDSVGRGYLDCWARAQAKVELLDDWFAEHGFLRGDGEPVGGARIYFTAVNSARLSLDRFERHLRARKRDAAAELQTYLEANYARRDG